LPFLEPVQFYFDDEALRTEAIHVNLLGYTPDEPKVAYLSAWLGDGENHTFTDFHSFKLVDVYTGKTVYSGEITLKQAADQPEYKVKDQSFNYNKTDIYGLDFSEYTIPGEYKIVVPGLGCSFEFEISADVWGKIYTVTMKGFLHQRSGIDLGPPYTDYQRPRNMHPGDEITIHTCDVDRFFSPADDEKGGGQRGVFDRIQASILPETEVPEAWGGWMDAGDFDQRMSHLYSVRKMALLLELNPEYFANQNLMIPESYDAIPDILDEAAWCLDLYWRTQGVYEEGGISWWIESIEHPRGGEPSWLNSLPTALVPPTPRACYHYAATAAQFAHAITPYDEERATLYLKSALDAVAWADAHSDAPDPFGRNARAVTEALAYVNLYRLTHDKQWHDRFIASIKKVFPNGIENDFTKNTTEMASIYLLMDPGNTLGKVRNAFRKAVLNLADELLDGAGQNTYHIFREQDEEVSRLVLPPRSILPVVIAHYLTGNRKYTDALSRTMQYTLGANPMNRSYISGVGERWFIPYHHDWEANNSPVPVGLPNFGPMFQTEDRWGWTGSWAATMIENAGLYPSPLLDWPFAEKCFNNAWIAPVNEFTVRHPMGEILLLSGYLAQEME